MDGAKVLGGSDSCVAHAGAGVTALGQARVLHNAEWRRVGPDLLLTACLAGG